VVALGAVAVLALLWLMLLGLGLVVARTIKWVEADEREGHVRHGL
jgi:hypothetical protein